MRKYILFGFFLLLFAACKGGISLGKGSAGTVVRPLTPEEINKKNSSIPKGNSVTEKPKIKSQELLANGNPAPQKPEIESQEKVIPTPIQPVPQSSYKTKPESLNTDSAEGSNTGSNPQASNPISPNINRNAPPAVVTSTIAVKNVDNKATTESIPLGLLDNSETEINNKNNSGIDLVELALWYLFAALMFLFAYIVYDIVSEKLRERKQLNKVPAKKKAIRPRRKTATKKSSKKKKAPKKKSVPKNKKLEEYKKKIPKGMFMKKKN